MSHRRNPFALLGLAVVALLLVLAPAASAKSRDRNHDRIPDKWETTHHLSLKVDQAKKDQDHDGMKNRAEFKAGTDPRDADTDNDGTEDGSEDSGTVVSFTGGTTLTIRLFKNDKTVEGTVDDQTELKCEGSESTSGTRAAAIRDHSGAGPGDTSGTGSDDASKPEDSADDQGGDNGQGEGADQTGVHHDGNDDGDKNDDHGDGADASCATDQLKAGTVIHEAELSTTPGGLHFDEIKLGAQPAASPAA